MGARRPELHTAAASYRAIGDEVPSPADRSAPSLRERPIHYSCDDTGSGAAYCTKCTRLRRPEFCIVKQGHWGFAIRGWLYRQE